MSARREKRRAPDGTEKWYWLVDFVFRHPDGRHERVRQLSPANSKRGAERYEKDLREHMLGLGPEAVAANDCPTLREFAETFIETYALGNNKHSEVESKKSILKHHLIPELGGYRLDRIRHDQISRYKALKLKAKLAPKTVNNQLSTLYCMLSEAYERRWMATLPQRQWAKAAKPSFRYLDFDEAARLVAQAEEPWRMMVLVALKAGLRMGELLALRWCDVDFSQRLVTVRQAVAYGELGTPKSDQPRSIAMGDELWTALKGYRHLRGPLVFCQQDGSPITKGMCKWPLWRASTKAGLGRIGWHVLRHTFASHLTILGAPIKTVQELLGHTDIRVTMRYAHLSPEARRGAVLLLDGALGVGHGKLMANTNQA
jgi:integrase